MVFAGRRLDFKEILEAPVVFAAGGPEILYLTLPTTLGRSYWCGNVSEQDALTSQRQLLRKVPRAQSNPGILSGYPGPAGASHVPNDMIVLRGWFIL